LSIGIQPRPCAGDIFIELSAGLRQQPLGFLTRRVDQRGPFVLTAAAHLVHLLVHLGAGLGGLALELLGRPLRFGGGLFGEPPRRRRSVLALFDDLQDRPKNQPIEDDRQNEDEEDDPEEREIREHGETTIYTMPHAPP
jgi:hypothetical protein